MSTQPQQPQTQQPVVVYPNAVPGPPPPHHHSDGSFGTVFIVLAVIIVISAMACFIGRLCNRRQISQTKPSEHNRNNNFGPKERDVEFGFDGRNPAGPKPVGGHGGEPSSKGIEMPGNGDVKDHPTGIRMPGNGDVKDHPTGIRMPGNGDPTGNRMPGNGEPTGIRIPAIARDHTGLRMGGPKPLHHGMER